MINELSIKKEIKISSSIELPISQYFQLLIRTSRTNALKLYLEALLEPLNKFAPLQTYTISLTARTYASFPCKDIFIWRSLWARSFRKSFSLFLSIKCTSLATKKYCQSKPLQQLSTKNGKNLFSKWSSLKTICMVRLVHLVLSTWSVMTKAVFLCMVPGDV